MAVYSFTITIEGDGETPEIAWTDAVTSFANDDGGMPSEHCLIEDIED